VIKKQSLRLPTRSAQDPINIERIRVPTALKETAYPQIDRPELIQPKRFTPSSGNCFEKKIGNSVARMLVAKALFPTSM
jgi:hypothetical protein